MLKNDKQQRPKRVLSAVRGKNGKINFQLAQIFTAVKRKN